MPRVKNSPQTRARRNKVLKLAKGYFGSKRTLYRTANEQVMRSLQYAYRDRRVRKREFRKLWIQRINAASTNLGLKYSKFIHGLTLAGIEVNRKMLADIAVNDPKGFQTLVNLANDALGQPKKVVVETKEVKVEAPKVEKTVSKPSLKGLLVADLKELANKENIEGYSSLLKQELIDELVKLGYED